MPKNRKRGTYNRNNAELIQHMEAKKIAALCAIKIFTRSLIHTFYKAANKEKQPTCHTAL